MNKIITILLLFVSCLAFGQGATPNLRNGLIAYYRLERTTGSVIDETTKNDATNSGATRGATGIRGNGFDFDSSTDVVNTGITTAYQRISISLWLNADGYGGGNSGRLLDKDDASAFEKILYADGGSSRLRFAHNFSTQFGQWSTPNNSILTTNWYHIVVIYDNSDIDNNPFIYINGSLQTLGEDDIPEGTASTNSDQFTIGNRGDLIRAFDGIIDEFMIFNREITELEKDQLYNSGNGLLFVQENFKKDKNYEKLINYVISRQYFGWINGAN